MASGDDRMKRIQERIRLLGVAGGARIPERVILEDKKDPRRVQNREPRGKSGAVIDENAKIFSFLMFISDSKNFNDFDNEYVKAGMEQLALSLGRPGEDVMIPWVELSSDLKIRLMLSNFRKGKRKIPIASNYFMITKIAPLTPELLRDFIKAYKQVHSDETAINFYNQWASRPEINAKLRAHTSIFKAFIPFYDYQRRLDSMLKHISEQINELEKKYRLPLIPYQDFSEERKRAMEYNEKLIPPTTNDKKRKNFLQLLQTANLDRYDAKKAIVRLAQIPEAKEEIKEIYNPYFNLADSLDIDSAPYREQLDNLIAEANIILPFDLFELLSRITFREMGIFNQLESANNLPLLVFKYDESTRLSLLKLALIETGDKNIENYNVDELRVLILKQRLVDSIPFKRSYKIADRIIAREVELRKANESRAKKGAVKQGYEMPLLTPQEVLEKIHLINRLVVLQDDISVQTLIGKTVPQLQDLYSELGKNEREILLQKLKDEGVDGEALSTASLYKLLIELKEKIKPIKIIAPVEKHIRRDVLYEVRDNKKLVSYLEIPIKNNRVDDTLLRMRVRTMYYADKLSVTEIIDLLSTQDYPITLKDIDLWIAQERDVEWEKANMLNKKDKEALLQAYESVLEKIRQREGKAIGRPYDAPVLPTQYEPTSLVQQWDTSRIPKKPLGRVDIPLRQKRFDLFEHGKEYSELELTPLAIQVAKQYLLKTMKILRRRLEGLYYFVQEGEASPMLSEISDDDVEKYVSNLIKSESLAPFITIGDLFLFVGKLITLSFFKRASGEACEATNSDSCIIPLFPKNVEFAREFLNLGFSIQLLSTRVSEYVSKIGSIDYFLFNDVSRDHRNAMINAYMSAHEKIGTVAERSEQLIPDSMYIPMFHIYSYDEEKDTKPVMFLEGDVEDEKMARKALGYDEFEEPKPPVLVEPSAFEIPELFDLIIRRVNTFADVDIHPIKKRSVSPKKSESKKKPSMEDLLSDDEEEKSKRKPSAEDLLSDDEDKKSSSSDGKSKKPSAEDLLSDDEDKPKKKPSMEDLLSSDEEEKPSVSPPKASSPRRSPRKKKECTTADCCIEECGGDTKGGVSSLVPEGENFRIVRFCSLECMKKYNFKKGKKKERTEDEVSLKALRKAIRDNSRVYVADILKKASPELMERIRKDKTILREAYDAQDENIYKTMLAITKMKPLVILGEEEEEKTVLPLDDIISRFKKLINSDEPDNDKMIKLVKKIDVTEKKGALKVSQIVFDKTIFDWLKLAVAFKNPVMFNYLRPKIGLTTNQLNVLRKVASENSAMLELIESSVSNKPKSTATVLAEELEE